MIFLYQVIHGNSSHYPSPNLQAAFPILPSIYEELPGLGIQSHELNSGQDPFLLYYYLVSSLYCRNLQEANLMAATARQTLSESLRVFNIAYRTSLEEEAKNSRQLG